MDVLNSIHTWVGQLTQMRFLICWMILLLFNSLVLLSDVAVGWRVPQYVERRGADMLRCLVVVGSRRSKASGRWSICRMTRSMRSYRTHRSVGLQSLLTRPRIDMTSWSRVGYNQPGGKEISLRYLDLGGHVLVPCLAAEHPRSSAL